MHHLRRMLRQQLLVAFAEVGSGVFVVVDNFVLPNNKVNIEGHNACLFRRSIASKLQFKPF